MPSLVRCAVFLCMCTFSLASQTNDLEEWKHDALVNAFNFVNNLVQPLSTEEHTALKNLMSKGTNILHNIESDLTAKQQNLIQLEESNTVAPSNAQNTATTFTAVLNHMVPETKQLASGDKKVLEGLLSGVLHSVTNAEVSDSLSSGLERVGERVLELSDTWAQKGTTQVLLDLLSGPDTNQVVHVANTFLKQMESQMSD